MMVLDLLQHLMYQVLTAVVVCVNMYSLLQPAVYHHSIMFRQLPLMWWGKDQQPHHKPFVSKLIRTKLSLMCPAIHWDILYSNAQPVCNVGFAYVVHLVYQYFLHSQLNSSGRILKFSLVHCMPHLRYCINSDRQLSLIIVCSSQTQKTAPFKLLYFPVTQCFVYMMNSLHLTVQSTMVLTQVTYSTLTLLLLMVLLCSHQT